MIWENHIGWDLEHKIMLHSHLSRNPLDSLSWVFLQDHSLKLPSNRAFLARGECIAVSRKTTCPPTDYKRWHSHWESRLVSGLSQAHIQSWTGIQKSFQPSHWWFDGPQENHGPKWQPDTAPILWTLYWRPATARRHRHTLAKRPGYKLDEACNQPINSLQALLTWPPRSLFQST